MTTNKEDELGKPISQSATPDTRDTSGRPETPTSQSPADLAASRSTFIDLFTSVPKAWQKTEAKLLGEESPEKLAAKRDIFIGLMSGISRAWEKIEPTLPPAKGRRQPDTQSPRQPGATTETTRQQGNLPFLPKRKQ